MGLIKRIRRSYKVRKIKEMFFRFISDIYETILNPKKNISVGITRDGWSIVIITTGKQLDNIRAQIKSIESELDDSPFEIIVVGPRDLTNANLGPYVKIVSYHELHLSPGWITRKNNVGIASTRYDKLVLTHDYLAFEPGWKKGFDRFGSNFDVCMNKIINMDGSRFVDWVTADFPRIGQALLPYKINMTKYQYMSGSYVIVKRDFYKRYPLNEKLRWGESEDVEWSNRTRKVTTFKMNTFSSVRCLKQKNMPPEIWIKNTEKLERELLKMNLNEKYS